MLFRGFSGLGMGHCFMKVVVKGSFIYSLVPHCTFTFINPLSANPTKWSKTLKQFVNKLPTSCLSLFDRFVELSLKGLS